MKRRSSQRRNSQSVVMDSLETRTLMSAATRVIGYLPDYQYADKIAKLDWSSVTQINYFSIKPNTDGTLPWNAQTGVGETTDHRPLTQLSDVVTKAHDHGVKVSIVIGGAGEYDDNMDDIFRNQTTTNTFVQKLSEFVSYFHLDGVDLDWEPAWGSPPLPSDLPAYSMMIGAINNAMPQIELSAAIQPTQVRLMSLSGVESHDYVLDNAAVGNLDRVGLMMYDMEYDNHSEYQESIDNLEFWRTRVGDANKDKLLLGLPFYGNAGTDWDHTAQKTFEQLRARSIVQNGVAPAPGDDFVNVSFPDAFGGARINWYFNGRDTLTDKTNYVRTHDYGGVMIWELGQDHFTGTGYDSDLSLMPAVKAAAGLNNNNANWATMDSGGHVTVEGTSGDDAFSMTNYRGQLIIWRTTNYGLQFPFAQVTHITINGNGGNDTVHAYSMSNLVTFNNNSGTGQMRMSSGQFVYDSDMGGSSTGTSNVDFTVDADATVTFNSTQHLKSLDVKGVLNMPASGNRAIVTDSLSIGATGKLDLFDNDLMVTTQARGTIENYIRSAYNFGSWNGASGIFSTVAKNSPAGNTSLGLLTGAEYLDNNGASTFHGATVGASDVLVKYTYFGDVDFNGSVDASDYNLIDFGYSNHLTGWAFGDADWSAGATDASDYNVIDFAFATQNGVL